MAPVCYDLYKPTVQVGCAENTIGPGGGVIFYDAGSVQPWGRFLEVAPQKWNGALVPCPTTAYVLYSVSSCGTAPGVPDGTSDWPQADKSWAACTRGSRWFGSPLMTVLPASAATLPDAIGTGRANTAAMLAASDCTGANTDGKDSTWSAFQKAANYRGGGLADWFVPSAKELVMLCKFGNRNAIGGFPSKLHYISSTTQTTDAYSKWRRVQFDANCSDDQEGLSEIGGAGAGTGWRQASDQLTRPIRAF